MGSRVRVKATPARCAVLFALATLYGIVCLINGIAQRDVGNEAYEIFRMKAVHAAAGSGGRLLLAGGSNVIWGFRSPLLEQQLGMPTTNFGIEREAEDPAALRELMVDEARAGDIVVYSSIAFWNMSSHDPVAARRFLDAAGLGEHGDWQEQLQFQASRYWALLPRDRTLAMTIPTLVRRYLLHVPSDFASRYTAYGDIKGCQPESFGAYDYKPASNRAAFVAGMREFQQRLARKQAKLIVDVPWMWVRAREQAAWRDEYQLVLDEIGASVPTTTASTGPMLFTDQSKFCNTPVHLSDAMARERSQHLAGFLASQGLAHGGAGDQQAAVGPSM